MTGDVPIDGDIRQTLEVLQAIRVLQRWLLARPLHAGAGLARCWSISNCVADFADAQTPEVTACPYLGAKSYRPRVRNFLLELDIDYM